jgi:hypothetical protein
MAEREGLEYIQWLSYVFTTQFCEEPSLSCFCHAKIPPELLKDYIHDAQQRGAMEAAEQARLVTSEFPALTVWSRHLMVHSYPESGRRHYGPGSTPRRHYDRGDPSSDTT